MMKYINTFLLMCLLALFVAERTRSDSTLIWSGAIVGITSGSCPAAYGFTEATELNGKTPLGTLAANGNVGDTGGADTITPTVSSLTAAAQTFTGSLATSSAVSGGTPAGSVSAPTVSWPAGVPTNASGAYTPGAISWPAGVPTLSGTTINSFSSVINHTHTITVTSLVQGGTTAANTGTHIMTSTATGGSARAPTAGDSFTASSANPAGGVASITPTINNQGTIAWPAGVPTIAAGSFTQPTISWPAGVPTNSTPTFTGSALGTHQHTLTATGTNGTSVVTGTLNNFDNRSAFVRVIWCKKS